MSTLSRLRAAAGLLGAVLLLLSSAAHGLAGWRHMQGRLTALAAPADLQQGLQLGWQLGSMAMLVFGLVAGWLCWRRWRGADDGQVVLALLALGYGGYGLWALAGTGEAGFVVFLIPAALLALAIPAPRTQP
jgi:hypothetical protein